MAIAGIKPLGEVKTIYTNPINGEPMGVNDVSAGEYYDREKARKILIKFANSKNAMRRDMTAEQIVDEFMNHN